MFNCVVQKYLNYLAYFIKLWYKIKQNVKIKNIPGVSLFMFIFLVYITAIKLLQYSFVFKFFCSLNYKFCFVCFIQSEYSAQERCQIDSFGNWRTLIIHRTGTIWPVAVGIISYCPASVPQITFLRNLMGCKGFKAPSRSVFGKISNNNMGQYQVLFPSFCVFLLSFFFPPTVVNLLQ